MKKNTLLFTLSLITVVGFAQTNLVPNPTFTQVEKKLKEKGQINVATPWTSPTLAQADLYVTKTKIVEIGVPANAHGEETPMDGDSYAGIVAYSFKGKVPRTYLQVKLTEALEEGKEYCVKFHVSLADLSKYSCNHLGIAISNEAMTANNSDILRFDKYIQSKKLVVYSAQYDWAPVCGIYKAAGGEEYITIGNFEPDENLKLVTVKRPKGFTKPQTSDAYYYIDNVSVISLEEAVKCDCDVTKGMENAETIKRDFNSDKGVNTTTIKIVNTDGTTNVQDPKVENQNTSTTTSTTTTGTNDDINGMVIGFSSKSFDMSKTATDQIDKIVAYLKSNADAKVSLIGYYDASEIDVEKLDGKRVSTISKYILSKGITIDRIVKELGGDMPIDDKVKTKNMRVEISIITP